MMLILCGFFCSGKTTLGKLCAKKMSIPFWDTDLEIESDFENKKSIQQIYQELGEEAFRSLETTILERIAPQRYGILSVGGGTLLIEKNRQILKQMGISIYLKASLTTLLTRMQNKRFPSYLRENHRELECEAIAKQRFPIYESHCEKILSTDLLTENEIADTICNLYSEVVDGK